MLKLQWPPDAKNWLPDAGKDWRQEEKGTTEDEMGWHQRLDGHAFEQALGVDDGQGSLACFGPWGRKESYMTERLNWNHHQLNLWWGHPICPGLLYAKGVNWETFPFRAGVCGLRELSVSKWSVTSQQIKTRQLGLLLPFFVFFAGLLKLKILMLNSKNYCCCIYSCKSTLIVRIRQSKSNL